MSEWGWAIAAAVLVITLVQVVAFYYLMRNGRDSSPWASSGRDRPGDASPRGAGTADGAEGAVGEGHEGTDRFDDDTDVTRCGRCGAPNERDPMIKFCYNCGGEL